MLPHHLITWVDTEFFVSNSVLAKTTLFIKKTQEIIYYNYVPVHFFQGNNEIDDKTYPSGSLTNTPQSTVVVFLENNMPEVVLDLYVTVIGLWDWLEPMDDPSPDDLDRIDKAFDGFRYDRESGGMIALRSDGGKVEDLRDRWTDSPLNEWYVAVPPPSELLVVVLSLELIFFTFGVFSSFLTQNYFFTQL